MDAKVLKTELDKATAEYQALDSDYRQHILRYAINLTVAEVAVVGFLLQNTNTQKIMNHHLPKMFLLVSLLSSLSSVYLSVLAIRIRADASKKLMHSYHYQIFSRQEEFNINISGVEAPKLVLENAQDKANDSLNDFMRATNKLSPVLNRAEYSLISGLIFSIFLVIYLVISI